MKFHLNDATGNVFTGYGAGYVEINRTRYSSNLVMTSDEIRTDDIPVSFDDLSREFFQRLLALDPEIVLLGTGNAIRFPHPRLTADLLAAHVGVEVMDNGAACRTFNVLAGEGRRVVVALLLG